jgi:hypothetical protein
VWRSPFRRVADISGWRKSIELQIRGCFKLLAKSGGPRLEVWAGVHPTENMLKHEVNVKTWGHTHPLQIRRQSLRSLAEHDDVLPREQFHRFDPVERLG